jgi:hypothetical protein
MTVAEFIEWLKTQDRTATVHVCQVWPDGDNCHFTPFQPRLSTTQTRMEVVQDEWPNAPIGTKILRLGRP